YTNVKYNLIKLQQDPGHALKILIYKHEVHEEYVMVKFCRMVHLQANFTECGLNRASVQYTLSLLGAADNANEEPTTIGPTTLGVALSPDSTMGSLLDKLLLTVRVWGFLSPKEVESFQMWKLEDHIMWNSKSVVLTGVMPKPSVVVEDIGAVANPLLNANAEDEEPAP
ncbi:unnamed protein product, partial [Durusdinium trenchii]